VNTKISQEIGITIIETWKSDDGSSWYKIWSDGWIEQGGYLYGISLNTTSTHNFLVPFNFTPTILFGGRGYKGTGSYEGGFNTVTLTGFTYIGINASKATINDFSWYACGY